MAASIESRPFVNRCTIGDKRVFFAVSVPRELVPEVTHESLHADRIGTEKAIAELVAVALSLRARVRT